MILDTELDSKTVLGGDQLVAGLRAVGEPTRLRIAALVSQGELTVTELCRILGQSQPRVSRHLKLLCEAGLLQRHSEGTSAFFSPSLDAEGRVLLGGVVGFLDPADPVIAADRQRLDSIRAERAAQAEDYFDQIAEQWESMRSRHVADADVEARLITIVEEHLGRSAAKSSAGTRRRPRLLLDIGTGTGRILELLADRFDKGIGIDLSTNMLNLARTRLIENELANCTVRQANIYALDIGDDGRDHRADVAVLHHVLHFLDDPAAALRQTAFTLAPGGLVVIVDFAPHSVDELLTEHQHRWSGFSTSQIESWCSDAWLEVVASHHLTPDSSSSMETLTVSIWVAVRSD
ncbi:MAG: metalloregulator ArsR/SmtB family transcription factor [Acidimicrobiia bacterium]|nr:metalloregulator ArsR/SmtB family transcription factor [Acidimicrobiia bacterium]